MILKALVFVIGLAGAVLSASIDCNTEQCAKPTKFYEELGCKAVFGAKSCCAKRFECPDFQNLDDNKCTFDGKEYKIGETLPRHNADTAKCIETCLCTREENEPAKFTCSKNNCGVSSFKEPGCINIYGDLNECCSTSVVCDEDEKESLASCFVGKEYREGEKFIPETNPCYECLCHKDFDNTTIADNPHCRKLNCEIDLRYKSFVQRGCLPVFNSEKCCPVDWECPKADKKIVKRSADDDASTHAPKHEVFVVTPSKNLEEYLDIVKLANHEDHEDHEEHSAVVTETLKESTTAAAPVPTLSSNPYEAPNSKSTLPVSVKVEESTTPLVKALADPTVVPVKGTSTTAASTKVSEKATEFTLPSTPFTPLPTQLSLGTTEFTTPRTSTDEATSESTSTTSTIESTSTTISTTTPKKHSSESKESGEEDENKNLFGEEVDDDEILPTMMFQTTTEQISESSVSTTASIAALSLNDAVKEKLLKVLAPKEPTTVVQSSTSLPTTESDSTTLKAPLAEILIYTEAPKVPVAEILIVTKEPETSTTTEASQIVKATETIYDLFPQVSIVAKAPEPRSLESSESVPQVYNVTSGPPSATTVESSPVSETSAAPVTSESTSQTPTTTPTFSENVTPTVFEELLTTLRKFVAKIDPSELTTEASKPSIMPELLPELPIPLYRPEFPSTADPPRPDPVKLSVSIPEAPLSKSAQVEFVNFTVSTQNDSPKVISKRSAPDADLIPQYFKQHYSISKNKGCVFNARTYKLGEVIKTSNECLKCICEYAPIGHCMLKEKCDF